MTSIQSGVLTLLRSAITGESLPLPEDFSLDDAMELIRRHHIAPLICEGAAHCGIDRNSPAMTSLIADSCKALIKSERQQHELSRICAAFEEAEISYMLLKGSRMKALYPRPELRVMGDADVLIRLDQYDVIKEKMQALGFQEGKETDHELVWKNNSLYLELHKRLLPTITPDLYSWFGDGWRLATCQEGSRWFMRPEDETVYMFTHFAKHFRYSGIGCRHIVDLWVWLRANPNLDNAYVQNSLSELGICEFSGHIHRLINYWFEDGNFDTVLEAIGEFIFASGSWGTSEMRVLGNEAFVEKHDLLPVKGKPAFLLRKFFPKIKTLQREYPVLQKVSWLLPLVWVYRPFYKVFVEKKSIRWEITKAKMITRQNLDERQQFLHSIGLDYNY